ncbi:MAG: hypothetical protein NTX82_07340 [Candidatus Parcubacteria bacterium]|nr:hypothetical protein [Candidatus Parcubacteria bacterium]
MAQDESYQAIVEKVYPNGPHGAYAVTRSDELGSVTFLLDSPVWQEKDFPEPGVLVILEDIRKKRSGWRAYKARFFKPSDEQRATSKEKGV